MSWHRHRDRHDHDRAATDHRCGHPFDDHLPAERRAVPLGPGDGRSARSAAGLAAAHPPGAAPSLRRAPAPPPVPLVRCGDLPQRRRRRSWRAHLGRAWLTAHPWRAVLLFGIPALLLWTAAGRIARRISRPLYALTRAAQEIGQGNLAARASLGRGGIDEMAVLSSAFNDMAARLERQLTEQRELLAAVSHELRTPLARIRLLVEIARQSGDAPDRHAGEHACDEHRTRGDRDRHAGGRAAGQRAAGVPGGHAQAARGGGGRAPGARARGRRRRPSCAAPPRRCRSSPIRR